MNDNFEKFLYDKTWNYSQKEIEKMMDEEMQKEPSQMNTAFVEACLEHLTEYDDNAKTAKTKNKARKYITLKRLFIAAIIATLVLATTISVCATTSNNSIKDTIVEYFNGGAHISYSDVSTTNNAKNKTSYNTFGKKLLDGGIKNVMLPKEFYDLKYCSLEFKSDSKSIYASFDYVNSETSVLITEYKSKQYVQDFDVGGDFTNSKKITINGNDIYIFELDGDKDSTSVTITYQIELTQYCINIQHCNIDEAEQLTQTIE